MLSLGDLLRNLEDELGRMARQCHSLEEATATAARRSGDDPIQQAQLLMAFQQLDMLSQALGDLARLAGEAGRSTLAELPIDPGVIRGNLQLTSLTDRLLGRDMDDTDHGADFLL